MEDTVLVGLVGPRMAIKEFTFDNAAIREMGSRVKFSARSGYAMLMLWEWVAEGIDRRLNFYSDGSTYGIELFDQGAHKRIEDRVFAKAIDLALNWVQIKLGHVDKPVKKKKRP